MSHKPGAYLGGVIDRKSLKARCFVDADTGCWHWRMAFSQGSPRVHVRREDGTSTAMRGRAAAVLIGTGSSPSRDTRCIPSPACKSEDCVNPDHALQVSVDEWGKWIAESGRLKNVPERMAANRRVAEKNRKFNADEIRMIRESLEVQHVLASRLGVSQNTIHAVKAGKTYRAPEVSISSVFAWRP
jgi:DNA-binding XRE family transcriptional regulator